jgi:hypothetical protein
MARNKVQFQKGLSEAQFAVLYGTEAWHDDAAAGAVHPITSFFEMKVLTLGHRQKRTPEIRTMG